MKKKWIFFFVVLIFGILVAHFTPDLYQKILHLQKNLIREMKQQIRSQREGILWILLAITFAYGFIHSIGPGHGKSFLSSYILKTKIPIWKLIGMTAMIAYLQAFLAYIFVIFFIDLASQSSMLTLYTFDQKTRMVSAAMIIVIGVFNLVVFRHKKTHTGEKSSQDCWVFSCIVGLCPCPGVMSVLLFMNLLGYESYMALFAFSTATGIFTMLSLFALMAGKLKLSFGREASDEFHHRLHIAGSLLLIAMGCFQLFF